MDDSMATESEEVRVKDSTLVKRKFKQKMVDEQVRGS